MQNENTWDNSQIFSSMESSEIQDSIEIIGRLINEISSDCEIFKEHVVFSMPFNTPPAELADLLKLATQTAKKRREIQVLVWDLRTYCRCEISVNSRNGLAKSVSYECEKLQSKFYQAIEPLNLFLTFTDDNFIGQYLKDSQNKGESFRIKNLRNKRQTTLSLSEENLIKELEVEGFHAWDHLYETLSGSIECEVVHNNETQKMGFASALNLMSSSDPELRKVAYQGISNAWKDKEESCAAILNALTGWRKKLDVKRSHSKRVHYLDPSLHDSRMSKNSLDSMMSVVEERKNVGLKAVHLIARVLNKVKADPWDRKCSLAGIKNSKPFNFDEAIEVIRNACGGAHPEINQFIDEMVKNHWIDARLGDSRLPGAYCTKFLSDKSPRVFMSFSGEASDVLTLAHELGHAFHNWQIRDLSIDETWYPLTLAETASTFFENLLQRYWENQQGDERKLSAWQRLQSTLLYLVDIPMRYDFELAMYKKTDKAKLMAGELRELMTQSWSNFYGDSMSMADDGYWMSKLHFYLSGVRFYNYPYTFGFLFSNGIIRKQEELGDDFYQTYINLLRDCGRKTCEDVALDYLQEDLTQPHFWNKSMDIVSRQIDQAEKIFFN